MPIHPKPVRDWTESEHRLRDRLTIDLAITVLVITGLLLLVSRCQV